MIFQEKYFSCYILLSVQIYLPGHHYFLRYYARCVLQLIVIQSATLKILKLSLAFLSGHFPTNHKSQDKNLDIFGTERATYFGT